MEDCRLSEILGRAFAYGEVDELALHLAENCSYESQYANRKFQGAEPILDNMKKVHANLNAACSYSFEIVELMSVFQSGISMESLEGDGSLRVCKHGLLLYQYNSKSPVALVICSVDECGKIANICLSRDKEIFNLEFFDEVTDEDSAEDLPSTVTPLTRHSVRVSELRSAFAGQKWVSDGEDDGKLYIWRNADKFIKDWLPGKGYDILESKVFEDCIGYRCIRKQCAYTIYMFAYGQRKTAMLDGEFCRKLADIPFSKDSIVLVVYLNVSRYADGGSVIYKVRDYSKNERDPDMWRLTLVENKPILVYFPRKEMADQVFQLMYAFNHEATDIYDCIIADQNPAISGCSECPGSFMNGAFYSTLLGVHREHGDMKLGYVRYNDVVYSSVPYVDGLGFFGFRTDNRTDRILEITCHRFDEQEKPVAEFIRTEIREPADLFSYIPALVRAVPLQSVPYERFSAALYFDNGECRKYVLPVDNADAEQEVVSFDRHVFSDGIWNSIKVAANHESRYRDYPECGSAITFKNGYYIAGTRCYLESSPYSEPQLTDNVIYEDQKCRVRKIWDWKANALYEDHETGLLKVLLSGSAFNWYGQSVFATIEGKRLTSLTFDLIDNFKDGLARVAISGQGFGYVDKEMAVVIPLHFDEADDFNDGKANVRLGDKRFCIDKSGRELSSGLTAMNGSYQEIGDFSEGMCRVSTLKLRMGDLAYHSDTSDVAGVWGFINENGEEIIAPQYIYAYDFETGIAFVAKGKWTIDPKWDNKYNTGRYWTEEELWGAIDMTGAEVIPCIFDEIKFFEDCTDYFMAHYGGWENGHWGVIDRKGQWVADPVFEDIDYAYQDGLFAFYETDRWDDDVPMGIYDINQKIVLFEPQFLDVGFLDNGDISVEVFDQELGRKIEKIIDRSGKERFKSIYTSIYTWKDPYEVLIRDGDEDKHGLIDKEGHVIVPCVHKTGWDGFDFENRRIIYTENGKQGVKDFAGNVMVPASYFEIRGKANPLLMVRVGEKDRYLEGLITSSGVTVIPALFKRIEWCSDKKHFYCCSEGHCEMYVWENQE